MFELKVCLIQMVNLIFTFRSHFKLELINFLNLENILYYIWTEYIVSL